MSPADIFFAASQAGDTVVTAVAVFGTGLLAAAGWAAARAILRAHYQRRDAREAAVALAQQARIDDIESRRPEPMPAVIAEPVIDDQPGINLAWHDQCELLWNTPNRTEENR